MTEKQSGHSEENLPRQDATQGGGDPPVECRAEDLRRLAETVDGYRGRNVHVYRGIDCAFEADTESNEVRPGKVPIFTSRTLLKRPNRKQPTLDQIIASIKSVKEPDALFWSEASVEKFVWPYYSALRIDVSDIKEAWDGHDEVVAILHTYPTRPYAVPFEGLHLGILSTAWFPEVRFMNLAAFRNL